MAKPAYKQVMTFEEYEKFIAELAGDGTHKVLLLDFVSLGGQVGYDKALEGKMNEQGLAKYLFRLAVPYNE